MVHKYLHGKKISDATGLFHLADKGMKRSNAWKLNLENIKLQVKHKSLTVRIINHCNKDWVAFSNTSALAATEVTGLVDGITG